MTRLVEALKEVGQTFELFQRGELGPCDSTPSAVPVPNLVPSSHCRIPAAVPGGVVPTEEKLVIRGLMGMFFDTDKTFLLPPAKGSMQRLKRLHSNNPDGKLLIVGHTDTVGLPDHNLDLSKRRAKNIEAYLKHTVEVWTAYYQPQLLSKQWGTIEDQYMLSVLPEEGPPFYTGKINGITYQQSTKDAITRFQEFTNTKRLEIDDNTTDLLDVDGYAGMETRRELVKAYMERSGDPLPKETPLFTQGCGEFHPEVPTGDGVPEARNRRTEVFFFPDQIVPPMPAGGCQAPGCIEYPQWRNNAGRMIDFTKESGSFEVLVINELTGQPIAEADVKLTGIESYVAQTNGLGEAFFEPLIPGEYTLLTSKDGFKTKTMPVTVASGKAVTHSIDQMQTASFVGESTLSVPGAALMQLLPSGQSQPQARDPNEEEAFFPNEWAASKTARGLHANRFAQIGDNIELSVTNPLDDELSVAELKKLPNKLDEYTISMYIPITLNQFGDVKVTILFAVGTEIRRHGLRNLFANSTDRVLVLVPGVEPSHTVLNRAWGRGITAVMIHQLFIKKYGYAISSWTVDILGAYSTGYRGLNGTIRNFADEPNNLDLRKTTLVVIYDALYRGDPPPKPGHNTHRALEKINVATNKKVLLAVYEVTGAGTPRNGGDTPVPQSLLKQTFGNRYRLLNLKPLRQALFALIYARMFDAAVKDGYFPTSSLPKSLQNLMANLPPRFQVASVDPPVVSSNTSLAAWAATHAVNVAGLQKHLETLRKDKIANSTFLLMGWPVPFIDDILHDGFIPEFGHELLIAPPKSLRLRMSIWAGANKFFPFANSSKIPQKELNTIKDNASGNVDDISLLWQIQNDVEKKNNKSVLKDKVSIGPSSLVGAQDMPQMKKDWKELVNACHGKKIQLLAGFKYVKQENGWREFNEWLDSAVPNPQIDKFAQTLVDFIINELPGCNGISFDIEAVYDKNLAKKSLLIRKQYTRRGDNLKLFYRTVAQKLKDENPDLIVAIALGAKSSDIRAASRGYDDKGQTVFDYRVVFKDDKNKEPIPNIVLRPMGYDLDQTGTLTEQQLMDAHEETIKYALDTVRVPPQQFQLGVSAVHQLPVHNKHNSINLLQVKKRCKLCRKYNVGLVIFSWSNLSSNWKDIDDALNQNFAPSAGQSAAQPFQVPITDLIKAFKVIP